MEEDLVTIAGFPTAHEAHFARIRIEEAGIECVLANEVISNVYWLYTQAMGGVQVQVRRSDAARATAILEESAETVLEAEFPEDEGPEPPDDAQAVRCLHCESTNVERTRRKLGWGAVALVLLGPLGLVIYLLLLLFIRETNSCRDCGFEWLD